MSGAEDVDRAYAAAAAAFESWGRDHARRTAANALLKIADAIEDARSRRSTRSSARTPASRSG